VELSTVAPRFSASAPDRPHASRLARMQVAAGMQSVVTLDHKLIEFRDADLRCLLPLLDSMRDRATLELAWADRRASMSLDRALALIAANALLLSEASVSGG
jgi:hypothetical protein